MKRIVGLVVAFVICLSMITIADPVELDLSSMSVDELIALRNEITQEILNRTGVIDDVIGSGTFVVGKDIREGVFLITNTGDTFCNYYIYDSQEEYSDRNESARGSFDPEKSLSVNLHDGQVLNLQNLGSATIIEQPNASWTP